jgi:molybdopterin-guanine dinucleotide biosynthesis protein B
MASLGLPVVGFVAASGTGKTTLIEQLVPRLRDLGLRVGYLKHAHHTFDIDTPGKDSHRVRSAGALQVLLASRRRWVLQVESNEHAAEPSLRDLLAHFDARALDLVLVEGFKHESHPKIEVHRAALGVPPLYPSDSSIMAIATDAALPPGHPRRLDLNDLGAVAELIALKVREWSAAGSGSGDGAS